jgi:peptidoglycan/xylan/chitin deacetylase (PgdA/CDA1 family)
VTALPGVFTMSFDCEGLWGPSNLTPSLRQRITQENLVAAYQGLRDILDQHELRATFAFVGAFVLSPEEARQHSDWFESASGRPWPRTQVFLDALAKGQMSGWLSSECFEIIRRAGCHELGTHGFQHIALEDHALTRADFERELSLAAKVGRLKNFTPRTLVFPRNQIGFVDTLAPAGISGYREYLGQRRLNLPLPESLQARWDSLAALGREVKLWQKPQPHPTQHTSTDQFQTTGSSAIAIPAGYFLNWRVGLRRRIPSKLSVARWSRMLAHAARHGGMVHLWSHPHNFITGDRQLEFFGEILREAAAWVRRGDLLNLTQDEYSRRCAEPTMSNSPALRAA